MAPLHANEVANVDCAALAILTLLLAHEGIGEAVKTVDRLKEAIVTLIVRRLSLIEGWNRFCRDLGLSPDRVALPSLWCRERDWLMDAVDQTVTAGTMALTLEPDESQAVAQCDRWHEFWNAVQ